MLTAVVALVSLLCSGHAAPEAGDGVARLLARGVELAQAADPSAVDALDAAFDAAAARRPASEPLGAEPHFWLGWALQRRSLSPAAATGDGGGGGAAAAADLARATAHFRAAVAAAPSHPESRYYYGAALVEAGRASAGAHAIAAALHAAPDHFDGSASKAQPN